MHRTRFVMAVKDQIILLTSRIWPTRQMLVLKYAAILQSFSTPSSLIRVPHASFGPQKAGVDEECLRLAASPKWAILLVTSLPRCGLPPPGKSFGFFRS